MGWGDQPRGVPDRSPRGVFMRRAARWLHPSEVASLLAPGRTDLRDRGRFRLPTSCEYPASAASMRRIETHDDRRFVLPLNRRQPPRVFVGGAAKLARPI